jgi:hypothetical protein
MNGLDITMEMEIDGYNAIMVGSEEGFTMSLIERGGPIIFKKDREECVREFKEAMGLMGSVMKLIAFEKTGTFNIK